MPHIPALDPATVTGPSAELLGDLKRKVGAVPNLYRTVAHSPAALRGLLALGDALGGGTLSPAFREQLALTLAEANGCDYCLSAHSLIGKRSGLSPEAIRDARQGRAADPRLEAGLRLARAVNETHGRAAAAELQAAREAGLSDGEIAEIIAHVALNVFTNAFNNVADPEIDFPRAAPAQAAD